MNPSPEEFSEDGTVLGMQKCSCGYEFDCATDVEGDQRPQPADFTLCLNCGEIFVFDPAMKVVQPTIQQIRDMPADTWAVLKRAQDIIRQQRFLDKRYAR